MLEIKPVLASKRWIYSKRPHLFKQEFFDISEFIFKKFRQRYPKSFWFRTKKNITKTAKKIKLIETGLTNKNQGSDPVTAKACRMVSSKLLAKIYAITNGKGDMLNLRIR